jgi:hypothetical protein
MAAPQEMILKLLFNDDGTFVGLEEINKELEKVDESTNKVDKSTKSLKAQYRQLNQELLNFEPGTEKYTEISQKMGELKDRMNDAADAVKGNTGPAIEGMSNSFGILQGQIATLDFEGVGQSLMNMANNVKRIDFKMFTDGIKSMITGLRRLTAAMVSNPVTLLFVILASTIALVATNWKEFSSLFKGESVVLNSLQKELGTLQAQNGAIKNKIASAKAYGDSLYQQYLLSQQLLANEIEQERVKMKIALLQDDQKAADEARAKRLELQNQQLQEQTQHIVDYYNTVRDADVLTDNNTKKEQEKIEAAKKYNSALEETRTKLALLRSDTSLSLSGVGNAFDISVYEDNEKKLLDAIDKSNKDVEKKYREEQKAILDARRDFEIQLRNEIFKSTATQDDYELEMLRQQYTKKLEEAKKNKANLKLVEEWYNNAIIELLTSQAQRESDLEEAKNRKKLEKQKAYNDAYAQAMADEQTTIETIQENLYESGLSAQDLELKTLREHYFQLITEAEYYGQNAQVLKDKQAKEELAITKKYAEAEAQLKVDTVAQGLQALTSLNESFTARTEKTAKRQFNTNKALNIAMSLVDTYAAIVKALNSPETVPTSVKIAQAVAVGVMGFANVAKIAKTQFGGTTPDTSMNQTGNPDSTTQANAPAIDFSGGQFNPNGPGTVETYVLAGNVANALEARQKIIDQSYL